MAVELKQGVPGSDERHVESDHLVLAEDELADELLRRGRWAGRGWMIASGTGLALAFGSWSVTVNVAGLIACPAFLALGLRTRRRYWDDAARQVGDAAMQRARWRSSGG